MSEVSTTENIAATLCRATNLWPKVSEDYNEFMVDQLLPAFDSLSKEQTDLVPKEAAEWAWAAIESFNNGNPLDPCPGFEDVFDVEDRAPMFTSVGGEDEHEKPVRGKGKGRKRNSKGKDAKTKGAREARPLANGKVVAMYDQMLADPKATVEQIIERLRQKSVVVQKSTTTQARSSFRNVVKFLASRDANPKSIQF